MSTSIILPKQGQSVENCIIVSWKKKVGDTIAAGEILCEVETDKALLEVESSASGTVLALYFEEGDEAPALAPIALVGERGEVALPPLNPPQGGGGLPSLSLKGGNTISPRARSLADKNGLDLSRITGSGPNGRIIERDVQALLGDKTRVTPLAKAIAAEQGIALPKQGSGVGGRVTAKDIAPHSQPQAAETIERIPLTGVRKVIASRMLDSLQNTAQLTLNAAADARNLLAYRKRLKMSAEALGLQNITLNDLILFAVARTLPQYPYLNALFDGETISQYQNVHLGFAIDTPRGLLVPVIRQANNLSLKQLATEAARLATEAQSGRISPDDLQGGTFSVSNLGNLGIESFTPLLNPPQAGILGVGNINLKPVQIDDEVQYIPHLNLSLTINHQLVDGAPGARFLQGLSEALKNIDLLTAM